MTAITWGLAPHDREPTSKGRGADAVSRTLAGAGVTGLATEAVVIATDPGCDPSIGPALLNEVKKLTNSVVHSSGKGN